ncbi:MULTISPECIES: hypothetical protein [Streptosporangium]|uniref:Uncharacterized protein n=1 Tax=Streptosporangium jomthongense TaxID=1193683 RepID=A0ABV8F191_9ACTN
MTWNGIVYATLSPGERKQSALPGDCPAGPSPRNDLSAVSASGRRYDYEGPVCNGRTWSVGSAESRSPSVFPT